MKLYYNLKKYLNIPPSIKTIIAHSRTTLHNLDMLKHNEWINFSEYEYLDSLIPTTSQTVADLQQFSNNNLNRTIENGVFQNPRIAALRSRRNSMSDNLYAMSTASGYSVVDKVKPSTFTILGHGANYNGAGMAETGNSSEEHPSDFERMLQMSKSDATTPIIKDKITTGSNFRFEIPLLTVDYHETFTFFFFCF